ncbi:MAG: cell division protein FtsZ [Acidobacteria bacterium]|nr:cell division protein FtsZ [Acidobacteriota bacterium]
MSIRDSAILIEENKMARPIIKVFGVGGAGCNAVNRMIESNLKHVEFIAVNTDLQSLIHSHAPMKIQIGERLTEGLGAGSDPKMGERSAIEDMDKLRSAIEGAHMVFITAGLGGGTGTGAAPVIARIASEMGILTVAIVTQPFEFEKNVRFRNFVEGYSQLIDHVDSMITIKNDKIFDILPDDTPWRMAYEEIDTILKNALRGIVDIVFVTGTENVDFADMRTIFGYKGFALMGLGEAAGEDRAREALTAALQSPLLDNFSLMESRGVIVNVTAGTGEHQLTVGENRYLLQTLNNELGEHVHMIKGTVEEESIGDKLRVTLIATGFDYGKIQGQGPLDIKRARTMREAYLEKRPSTGGVPEITSDDLEPTKQIESKPVENVCGEHPCSQIATELLQTDEYKELRRSPSVAGMDSGDMDKVRKIPAFLRKAIQTGNLNKK